MCTGDIIEQMLAHAYPCNAKVAYNEQPEVVAKYTWSRPNTKTIPECPPPPPPPPPTDFFFFFGADPQEISVPFQLWQMTVSPNECSLRHLNPIPSDSQLFLSFGFSTSHERRGIDKNTTSIVKKRVQKLLAAWVYTTQLYSGDTSPRKLILSLKQWVISLNIVTDLATVPLHVALLKLKKEKEKPSSGVKSVLSVSQVTNESQC